MPEVFKWTPQRSYSVTREPNVSVVKLGDGYEQRQAKGSTHCLTATPWSLKAVAQDAVMVETWRSRLKHS